MEYLRQVVMRGIGIAKAAISLRLCYAMPGTDVAYGGTIWACEYLYAPTGHRRRSIRQDQYHQRSPIRPGSLYGYWHTACCYDFPRRSADVSAPIHEDARTGSIIRYLRTAHPIAPCVISVLHSIASYTISASHFRV
eukprot:3940518-Rhodomonas_salina.1